MTTRTTTRSILPKIWLRLYSWWFVWNINSSIHHSWNTTTLWVQAQSTTTTTSVTPSGLQSTFGEITMVGGMVYEPLKDVVYVTGQVGANGCFVGILARSSMQWISRITLPEPAICQTLNVASRRTTSGQSLLLELLAITEQGGLLTDTRITGTTKAQQYGMIVPLEIQASAEAGGYVAKSISQGLLLHQDVVQYPRAIVMDPFHSNYLYVASMQSTSKAFTTEFTNTDETTPNLTPSGILKFGSHYFLQVERVAYDETNHESSNLHPSWRKPFGVQSLKTPTTSSNSNDDVSVHLSHMIWNKGALIVTGNTRGSGQAFGEGTVISSSSGSTRYWMDGFLTKLDPNTGSFWQQGGTNANSVRRFRKTTTNDDTYITSICSSGIEAEELFVVGYFGNGIESKAIPFIAKLDALSLETMWEQTFQATNNAKAMSCGVDTTDSSTGTTASSVYMAGTVYDSGSFDTTSSLGLDDVFVIQVSADDGSMHWIQQLGTSGKERLIPATGLAVVPHGNGGILLVGDTTGNFMAMRSSSSSTTTATTSTPSSTASSSSLNDDYEMFVVQVDSLGNIPPTMESGIGYGASSNTGGNVPIQVPTREKNSDATSDSSSNSNGSGPLPEEIPTKAPLQSAESSKDIAKKKGFMGMYIVIGIVMVVVLVGGFVVKTAKQEKVTERALVFSYLQGFDVEDVDVRHSATGGWHGTYVGKLAIGSDQKKAISHSSIVKDSLFVDFDSTSSQKKNKNKNNRSKTMEHDDDFQDEVDDDDADDNNHNYRDFKIGNIDYEDDDDNDDDDFDDIGRFADEDDPNNKDDNNNPWGRDII